MALSEKIELLGKGLYKNIPDELTLASIPTISELDYVSGEDFDETMINKILPKAVEEDVNFRELLEIDYQWICRCLRILNFGPYHTTNAIYCGSCGERSYGEYLVDLRTIECKVLPEGFVNDVTITKDEFLDYDKSVSFKLPTIGQMLAAGKDKAFKLPDGRQNRELSRICYMITAIDGQKSLTPMEVKFKIEDKMSAADYFMLKERITELSDYGLRAGGSTICPKCGNPSAAFVALVDDRFFRPSARALQQWKHDKDQRKGKDISRNKTDNV
jgi:hypothetical protein